MNQTNINCYDKKFDNFCFLEKLLPITKESCFTDHCLKQTKKEPKSTVKDCVSPPISSNFQRFLEDSKECAYKRNCFPLAKSIVNPHITHQGISDRTFGKKIIWGDSVQSVLQEETKGNERGSISSYKTLNYPFYRSFSPSKKVNMGYNCMFDGNGRFGIVSDSRIKGEGKQMSKLLHPNPNYEKFEKAESSICNREDIVFGRESYKDPLTARDLIHYRSSPHNAGTPIANIRLHLMKAISNNFDNVTQAFAFFDKKEVGVIDSEALRETLQQFNIRLSGQQLHELIQQCKNPNGRILMRTKMQRECCDFQKDCNNAEKVSEEAVIEASCENTINFSEFANFLTFQAVLPLGSKGNRLVRKTCKLQESTYQNDYLHGKQIKTSDWKSFGRPTELNGVSKHVDSVGKLINPSPFTLFGLTQQDINTFQPRLQEEVCE